MAIDIDRDDLDGGPWTLLDLSAQRGGDNRLAAESAKECSEMLHVLLLARDLDR